MNFENPYQPPAVAEASQQPDGLLNPLELRTTRNGLFAVYYGICAILIGILGGGFGMVVGGIIGVTVVAVLSAVLFFGGIFGGSIAMLVGLIWCLTVPRESGAKGFVQTTVGLQALSILLAFGGFAALMFTAVPSSGPPSNSVAMMVGSNLLSLVNGVLGLIAFVCFLLFLRNVARYIRRPDLEATASTVLKLIATLVTLYFVMIGFALVTVISEVGGLALILGLIGLTVLILGLVSFLKYANLVLYLAKAIPTGAA